MWKRQGTGSRRRNLVPGQRRERDCQKILRDAHNRMTQTPTILLVAFKFPPYAGVGGNRWMHLTSQLANLGCKIHVVTVRWHGAKSSPWESREKPEGLQVHRIPSGFPHNLYYSRSASRLVKRLKKVLFSTSLLGGLWWDDEAQHWRRYLFPFCRRLARKVAFDVMVATGHPFEANYLAALLSREIGVPLIQDLRDPWLDNPFARYSNEQREVVRQKMSLALRGCSRVVTVSHGLSEIYQKYSNSPQKHKVIHNGHGIETSVESPQGRQMSNRQSFKFVYLGNIGNGRDEPFEALMEGLLAARVRAGVHARLFVYSLQGPSLERRYSRYVDEGLLQFESPAGQAEIAAVLRKYDAAIHLTARAMPFAVSTKVFEYAAARVPTISLNYGGDVEPLIDEMDCGFSINLLETDPSDGLMDALQQLHRPFTYRVERFHWKALAAKYLETINEVMLEHAQGQ